MTIRNFVQQSASLLAFWAVSTAAFQAQGQDSLWFRVNEVSFGKKFGVSVERLVSTATLVLVDRAGTVLMEERVPAGSFSRMYNMKNLPNGHYDLILRTPLREVMQPLVLTDYHVKADPTKQLVSFLPVVNVGDDYVDVSLLNLDKSRLSVLFTDEQGRVVFEDRTRSAHKFERRYRTDRLEAGTYTIHIRAGERTYHKDLVVR